MELYIALLAIFLHVVNYNTTAQIEYATKIITKILGTNAIYYYAAYLVASALVRDHFIQQALITNQNSLPIDLPILQPLGSLLFILGILLNLWTLHVLGIKGMYNGDSFGWLFDVPVTGGPYQFFNDPQYVGTTWSMLGSTLYYQSLHGFILSFWMGIVFYISVTYIEFPHMIKIYANKNQKKKE